MPNKRLFMIKFCKDDSLHPYNTTNRVSKPGRLNPVRFKNLMGFENRQATGAGFLKFAGSVSNSITDN